MTKNLALLIPAIVLALFGAKLSSELLVKHTAKAGAQGSGWFDTLCSSADDPSIDCASVLASRWAYFPPLDENKKPISPMTLPAALLGLTYFTAMAVWYVFVGRPSYERRYWHLVPLLVNLAGAAGSIFFTYVMLTQLDARCNLCLLSHACNVVLLVLSIFLWPRRNTATPVQAITEEETAAGTFAPTPVPLAFPAHPSLRLVLATLSLAVTALFAQQYMYGGRVLKGQNDEYQKYINTLGNDIALLRAGYEKQPKQVIPVRSDDPIRGSGKDLMEMVVFSDFECPKCREFAERVDEELLPLFEDKLKVVFKHFPACMDCNPLVSRTLHKHACTSALAAEAARFQGGSEAFWKMHDRLFAESARLGRFDYGKAATELGLDPDRLMEDMKSPDLLARIKEDVELAQKVGVTGTPMVYVSGRKVESIARSSKAFWMELKKAYDRSVEKRQTGGKRTSSQPATTAESPPVSPM